MKRLAIAAFVVCVPALAVAQVPGYGSYGLTFVSGGGGGGISPPAGQIGGTTGSPTILGIRETSGPTLLTFGAVADTQCLARSGTTVAGTTCGGGGGALFAKHFAMDMVIATTASWPITSPAPFSGTQLNLANYRTLDPTTAQGFGVELPLPTGSTGITVIIDAAPATSGFTTNNAARYGMACRQKGSSAAFTTQLATASVYADNTNIQRHTLSFTLSGLSLTAATTALCQFHRAAADAGDTLTATVNLLDMYVSVQ